MTGPRTVTIITAWGPIQVPCEQVSDDFVINAALDTDAETGEVTLGGGFLVTHRHTGYAMPGPQVCIACARATARLLAAIRGVDWQSLDPANTAAFSASLRPDVGVEIRDALAVLEFCDQELCPHPVDVTKGRCMT
jgi:hypothetical protein